MNKKILNIRINHPKSTIKTNQASYPATQTLYLNQINFVTKYTLKKTTESVQSHSN